MTLHSLRIVKTWIVLLGQIVLHCSWVGIVSHKRDSVEDNNLVNILCFLFASFYNQFVPCLCQLLLNNTREQAYECMESKALLQQYNSSWDQNKCQEGLECIGAFIVKHLFRL